MKNSFEVPLPVDDAWKILMDVRRIAPCMPGAEILEVVDPKTYKGKVAVRLGPVALSFLGTARFEEIDDVAHRARVKGQGSDAKGRGGATGVFTFTASPAAGGTRIDVETTLNLSGSVAQYGRGTGIIQDVASQIIGQFARSLREMLEYEKDVNASQKETDPSSLGVLPPASPKPISGITLMFRVLWNSIRRLLGASV